MQIAVSSNCQTEGVANALMALYPQAVLRVFTLPFPLEGEGTVAAVAEKLDQIGVWVTIAPQAFIDKVLAAMPNQAVRVVRIPAVGFSAFHPDLCYAKDTATDQLTRNHYNSAIGAWAYTRGVSVEAAARLFHEGTYRQLGYYDMWEPSVAHLKSLFAYAGMPDEFESFWWSIRRGGNFMHSINHPHVHVLVRLAKIVGIKLGLSPEIMDNHIEVHDSLDVVVWPLYPEVAQNLGVAGGGYRWTVSRGRYINGVSAYLEYAFDDYRQQGIEPANLVILNRDNATLDRVLGSQLEALP